MHFGVVVLLIVSLYVCWFYLIRYCLQNKTCLSSFRIPQSLTVHCWLMLFWFGCLCFSSLLAVCGAEGAVFSGPVKLSSSQAKPGSSQGRSVSISNDGNVMASGAFNDGSYVGCVFMFQRSGHNSEWEQYGPKLVGKNHSGFFVWQGWDVALSGNGNVVASAGPSNNQSAGAVWVFGREDSTSPYLQQGNQLAPNDGAGPSFFGSSLAINDNGNFLFVGGYTDDNYLGAVWYFVFDSELNVWQQQGSKIVPESYVGNTVGFGTSLACNDEGTIIVVGGPNDDGGTGASWVLSLSQQEGKTWAFDAKLIGTNYTNYVNHSSNQGLSVAIAGDGNTILVSSGSDNLGDGAAWSFVRSADNEWKQLGNKILAFNTTTKKDNFGQSVALSLDGSLAVIGAFRDNKATGSAFVFVRNITDDNGNFTETQKLYATDQVGGVSFGMTVALNGLGDTAVVGAPYCDSQVGAAYVFGTTTISLAPITKSDSIDNNTTNSIIAGVVAGVAALLLLLCVLWTYQRSSSNSNSSKKFVLRHWDQRQASVEAHHNNNQLQQQHQEQNQEQQFKEPQDPLPVARLVEGDDGL